MAREIRSNQPQDSRRRGKNVTRARLSAANFIPSPASVFEKVSAQEFKFLFLPFLFLLSRHGHTVQSFPVVSHAQLVLTR